MILGNLFEITFSISSMCIAKTLSEKLWGFRLLSASDALVPRACRHSLAALNRAALQMVVWGDTAETKQHLPGLVIRRDWETWKKFRNYQKACYSEWRGNTDNAEVRRYPSQRMDGKFCVFFLLQWKITCLHLRVLSPMFHCNQQQRNFS